MSDLKNILNDNNEWNEEKLMQYLAGNLSAEEQNAIEQQMANSSFTTDALEGLQHFKNNNDINVCITELNKQLQKQTASNKKRKTKRKIQNIQNIEIIVAIVILLCLLGYFAIKKYVEKKQPIQHPIEQTQ
ncbi:MAG: hypothetical protein JSR09_08105 [Bacteroidetes bacterium]|nr:hypothetical protein [Bacteroidota bacterium]MBS1649656.1 hypothetical protein [Bacteroidota bacterium]